MNEQKMVFIPPNQEEIACYAAHLWNAEGRQPGRDLDYWLQAEAHLIVDRKFAMGLMRHLEWGGEEIAFTLPIIDIRDRNAPTRAVRKSCKKRASTVDEPRRQRA